MFRRLLSVLICLVILFTSSIPAKALVADVVLLDTIASAVVVTLTALGLSLSSSNTDYNRAFGMAVYRSMSTAAQKAVETAALVKVGTALVVRYTADQWSTLNNWLSSLSLSDSSVSIPIISEFVYNPVSFSELPISPILDSSMRLTESWDGSTIFTKLDSSSSSFSQVSVIDNKTCISILDASFSVFFYDTSPKNPSTFRMRLYRPYINSVTSYNPTTDTYHIRKAIMQSYDYYNAPLAEYDHYTPSWKIGKGCRIPYLFDHTIMQIDGSIVLVPPKAVSSSDYITILGNYDTVFDFQKACLEAGTIVGVPDMDAGIVIGTSDTPLDSTLDVTVPLPFDMPVETSYYPPAAGTLAPPKTLAPDLTIEFPIPYVGDLPLDDNVPTKLKDLTDDLPIDWDAVTDKAPSTDLPTYRDDTGTIVDAPTSDYTGDIPNVDVDTEPGEIVIPDADPEVEDSDLPRFKLSSLFLSKFPFCIPFDLLNALKMLVAPARPPKINVVIPLQAFSFRHTWAFCIDFSQFDTLASICRWFFAAIWIVVLIVISKRLIK